MTTTTPASVTPETVKERVQRGARIIDVRSPAEFQSIHIPGSYNVPQDLLSERRQEFTRHVDEPVILVCASGMRAKQADEMLRGAGYDQLSVLEGGITAWEQQDQDVVRGAQKWSLERQVRGVAGGLVTVGVLAGQLYWRPLTAIALLVGLGLSFSAISNTCGMAAVLSKLPYNQGATCDIRQVMNELAADSRS